MKIKVPFPHRPVCLNLSECEIEKVVEVSTAQFNDFLAHPLSEHDFIAENADPMIQTSDGVFHCILVLGVGQQDGVLIESEGYGHACYSTFVLGARTILLAEQGQTAAPIHLSDLLFLGLPQNDVYLVHDDDVGFVPACDLPSLSISERERFSELLTAEVTAITQGSYGVELKLGGIDSQRLVEYDKALAAGQLENPAGSVNRLVGLELLGDQKPQVRRLRDIDISFSDEITEINGKLNFYMNAAFNVDEVFGTHVETADNDDWLNIYADFDMATRQVCDTLSIVLHRGNGEVVEELTYQLNQTEKAMLLAKMDAYCSVRDGVSLEQFRIEAQAAAEDIGGCNQGGMTEQQLWAH